MIDMPYNDLSPQVLEQLAKGVFLTVGDAYKANVMTIGWGNIGFIWGRPIFMVLVRYSRYTYKLLEERKEFSVSVPLSRDMKKELTFCGTNSGRDYDKFKECSLTPASPKVLSTPVVGECDRFYECSVVCRQAIEPGSLDQGIKDAFYPVQDYHVLYYGEIKASYQKA